jgi:hypothetical protein
MIARITGWTFQAADDHVGLRPKDSPEDAWIRYVERMRPVAAIDELVRRHCAAARLRVNAVHELELTLTHEGEEAAVVALDCDDGGGELWRTVGFVVLDDFYAETVGVTRAPELRARVAEAVKRLVVGDAHHLAGRRRLFPYDGPPGWTRHLRGTPLVHLWLPPGHPIDPATISVGAAWPTSGCSPRDVTRLLLSQTRPGFRVLARGGPDPVRTRGGLGGNLWRRFGQRGGAAWTQLVAILGSGGHSYVLHLDSPTDAAAANEALFRALLESVRPLPLAPRALAQRSHAMRHWAE